MRKIKIDISDHRKDNTLRWWEWILYIALLGIVVVFFGLIFVNVLVWFFVQIINSPLGP